jgi:hypothetical protein
MEDGTWNKAYCFVYITCTMGSVGGRGDSLQADRRFHVCRGGGGRGETMPARQRRGGGGEVDPGNGLYKSQKVLEEGGKA